MLILLNVKSCIIVPSQRYSKLQPLEAVQVDAFICASTHSCISIGQELVLVRLECSPSIICSLLQYNYHESPHQECCVSLLCIIERCVMINLIALILRVIHQLLELLAEQMYFTKIEWSKVSEERLVDQVVIDAEIEGMLARLRRILVTNPVQALRDDLDWLV